MRYYRVEFVGSRFLDEISRRKNEYLKELKSIVLDSPADYSLVMATIGKWVH